MSGECDPLGIVQEVYHTNKWFEIQTDHLISAKRPDLVIVNIPADHRVKLKENEKRDKYINLASELKKNYWIWM